MHLYTRVSMAELKTKPNTASVTKFIARVPDKEKREDSKTLLKLFAKTTKQKPKMWGTAIVGYGMYHYKSERSSQEGDWPLVAFSPRKQNLTLYVMPGFAGLKAELKKLGPHKTSVGCLYIKRLADVDTRVVETIIKKAYLEMKKGIKRKRTLLD
jgi:hypothetical protein